MAVFWEFLLVFSAIGCGWLLGRYASGGLPFGPGHAEAYRRYYRGLNFLLNDKPDEAIDDFTQSLEVTPETFETHLALGTLMRNKGAVERAIQIHQNLLARPSLPPARLHQAHLELARDFIKAGLYDRAEKILLDLVQQSEELRSICLRHLIEIYQAEREWHKAIETGSRLLPRRNLFLSKPDPDPQLEGALAHYHCELAQKALRAGRHDEARGQLKEALIRDPKSVRASMLLGEVEFHSGQYDDAIEALHRVREQAPAMVPEIVPLLQRCYDATGRRPQLRPFLEECLDESPSSRLVLAVAEEIRQQEGNDAALQFLTTRVRKRPTLRGLLAAASVYRETRAVEETYAPLDVLQTALERLVAGKASYQCNHCGFSGRQLHWLCPRCKQWNTVQPILGVEGD
jgi:lipopolysaccharide biosynthesis regulator YciM